MYHVVQLGNRVFKIGSGHARGTNTADFFLVGQHGAQGSVRHTLPVQQSGHGGEGAHTVIVTVTQNHAPVKAQVTSLSGRHDFQFGRDEVLFLHSVGIGENLQYIGLDGVAFRVLQGHAAHNQVQSIAFNDVLGRLTHQIGRKVNQ